MNKFSVAAVGVFGFWLSNSVLAQIPVTDGSVLTQQIQQVVSWGQQLQQMKAQIEQQKQAYQAITGPRGLGNLLNNPALKNELPADWQSVYTAIQKGGYQGLTGSAKSIRNANKIVDCDQKLETARILCEREANKPAQDKAFVQDAYTHAQARLSNIEGLMSQIDTTSDPKAIADLGARIQIEQAMIQNEQTKLQMFRMLAEAEQALIIQQKKEAEILNLKKPSMARDGSLKPVQF